MIAAIYARKSTDDSDRAVEARSTARQIESATTYARAKGWTVDPRYIFVDENTSGAEWKQRPGFNALLAALEPRPPFGVVVVSELSRIGRDAVRIEINPQPACRIGCRDNTVKGPARVDARCSGAADK